LTSSGIEAASSGIEAASKRHRSGIEAASKRHRSGIERHRAGTNEMRRLNGLTEDRKERTEK
jgi:hypothetical protein